LKFFQKKSKKPVINNNTQKGQLYTQISLFNIKEILKIKEKFLGLLSKKIKEVYKTINELRKNKPKLNIISKEPLRKQVLISISSTNVSKFIILSRKYITNINRALKNIKSNIMADFIKADQ